MEETRYGELRFGGKWRNKVERVREERERITGGKRKREWMLKGKGGKRKNEKR